MSLALSAPGRIGAVLRHRDLRWLLGAGLVSQTGDWMLATGLGFEVYALTGSTVASATALLASQAPQAVFGSFAGVLVDRWDRRRVMIAINLALAAVLLPLFAVRTPSQVWIIFVVVALSGCLTPFFVAAEATMLPAVVEEKDLITANAVNAQVRNVSRLVGAALGGVLIAGGNLLWLAVADLTTFVLAALCLALIRFRPAVVEPQPLRLARDWVDGLRVIRRSRALLIVLIFFGVTGVGEAVMGALFAPYVNGVLGGGGSSFGTIMAAQAVGGVLGGLIITAVGHRFSSKALFGWGAVAFGVGDLALFLYPLIPRLDHRVWPGVVIIAFVGLPGAALFAGMLTIFQTHTENRVRGRVFGTLTTVQNVAMLASTYAAGVLAERFGVVAVISVQGAIYLIVGIVVLLGLRPAEPPLAEAGQPGTEGTGFDAWVDNPLNSTRLPSMSSASNVRLRTVTDPVAMRAFAHPLRLQLHSLVAREGSLTAADAARQLGISHALASHHLRQLAKYGFVEAADSDDNRARPWRVTATSLDLKPSEPQARASVDTLDRYYAEKAVQDLASFQERRAADEASGWEDAAGMRTALLYLNPAELNEVMEAWSKIVMPLADRRPIGHADQRPDDAVPVSFSLIAVPIERTEQGG